MAFKGAVELAHELERTKIDIENYRITIKEMEQTILVLERKLRDLQPYELGAYER